MASRYVVEHLNHLGIVAEVCREIGVADWLDQQEPTHRQQVSVGTATVAMVLNGLGFSNRQLYLVPQFFADKPVEHLLGPGIAAVDLNDDCLGRTLDWLYAQDVTALFAGLAHRARQAFGVTVDRLHADTTSFHVHGQYLPPETTDDATAPAVMQITYGYSRDHRADLQQWMLALITSGDGVPQFLQPLDGNASDKASLLAAVTGLTAQLQPTAEAPGVFVADSGLYSQANMTQLNVAGVRWVSRVPETATLAQQAVQTEPGTWQRDDADTRQWWRHCLRVPNAGSSSGRTTGSSGRGRRSNGRRRKRNRRGPNACGTSATRSLRARRTRWPPLPRRRNAARVGCRWSRGWWRRSNRPSGVDPARTGAPRPSRSGRFRRR